MQSALDMAGRHYEELEGQSARIAIPLVTYDQDEYRARREKKKAKKGPSKFASTAYNDDDFESYKPKTQGSTSRRRQQSGKGALNELFAAVIESCINFDRQKIFTQLVKKNDAPNYYDVIKNPICLHQMKAKAKRQDYVSQEELMRDFALMRENALFYNGPQSEIGKIAINIEQHAEEELLQHDQDIKNLELLVLEQ